MHSLAYRLFLLRSTVRQTDFFLYLWLCEGLTCFFETKDKHKLYEQNIEVYPCEKTGYENL